MSAPVAGTGPGAGRLVLGGAGVLLGLYGAWLLLSRQDLGEVGGGGILGVATWLAAGLLLHDVVLSAAVLLAGALLARLLPATVRGPVTAGLVVLGTLTLMAVPVLGRFGAKPDNPTLLDRPYLVGWLVLALLVAVAVAAVASLRRRAAGGPDEGGDGDADGDGDGGGARGGTRRGQ